MHTTIYTTFITILYYFTTLLYIINRNYGITQLIHTRSHTHTYEQVYIAKSHLFEPDIF